MTMTESERKEKFSYLNRKLVAARRTAESQFSLQRSLNLIEAICEVAKFRLETGEEKKAVFLAQEANSHISNQKMRIPEDVEFDFCMRIAHLFGQYEVYDQARSYYEKALQTGIDIGLTYDLRQGFICNDVALACQKLECYTEAENYYHQALEIMTEIEGTKGPSVAAVCHNLSVFYFHQREYGSAVEYLQMAMHIFHQMNGSGSEEMVRSHFYLAKIHSTAGSEQLAEYHFNRGVHLAGEHGRMTYEEMLHQQFLPLEVTRELPWLTT